MDDNKPVSQPNSSLGSVDSQSTPSTPTPPPSSNLPPLENKPFSPPVLPNTPTESTNPVKDQTTTDVPGSSSAPTVPPSPNPTMPASPPKNKKRILLPVLGIFLLLGLTFTIFQLSKKTRLAEIFQQVGQYASPSTSIPPGGTWGQQHCAGGIAAGVNSIDTHCCCDDPGSSSRCGRGCAFDGEAAYNPSMGTVIQYCQADGVGSDGKPKYKVAWRSRDASHCDEEGLCSGIDDPSRTSGSCSQCNNKWRKPPGNPTPSPSYAPPSSAPPSSNPTPSPSYAPPSSAPPSAATPSPSSTTPYLICTGLSRTPGEATAPSFSVGDPVTFSCACEETVTEPFFYNYRIQTPSNSTDEWTYPSDWQNLSGNTPVYTIEEIGSYIVQCQVCTSTTNCTEWGQQTGWTP